LWRRAETKPVGGEALLEHHARNANIHQFIEPESGVNA
jgi:hypothetical protein